MEHAIGTRIVIDDGIELEVAARRGISCKGCAFEYMDGYCEVKPYAECSAKYRTDHKNIIYKEITMTAIISEATKRELLNLAGSLNDVVNDIHRQVRTGKVFVHDYDTWVKLKKILEE